MERMSPAPTPVPLEDADTLAIVRRLADLNARIAELNGEAESLKAELRTRLKPGAYDVGGDKPLKLQPTRSFDREAGYALVPKNLRKACLTITIDPAKVKSHLTPAQLEDCMVESGQPKVVLG